jgi:hypothetical protein
MQSRTREAFIFLLWGTSVLLGGAFLYNPENRVGVAGGLRWLTLLISIVLGGALILSGILTWQKGRQYTQQIRTPSLSLVSVGLLAMGTSIAVFRPWEYGGLAGGLRLWALLGFLVGGGLFVTFGLYCYRMRNPKVSLMVLAGLTGAGLFYPLNELGLFLDIHPILWALLLILFISSPTLGIYYGWPRLNTASTHSAR